MQWISDNPLQAYSLVTPLIQTNNNYEVTTLFTSKVQQLRAT